MKPLIEARRHTGQQHQRPRREHEQEDQFNRRAHLADDRLDLLDQRVHLDDHDGGKLPDQIIEQQFPPGFQPHRGQEGRAEMIDRSRREDDEEIRLHVVPAHRAQIGHLGADELLVDLEADFVADADVEPVGVLLVNRNQAGTGIVAPPCPRGDAVVGWRLVGPGDLPAAEPAPHLAIFALGTLAAVGVDRASGGALGQLVVFQQA